MYHLAIVKAYTVLLFHYLLTAKLFISAVEGVSHLHLIAH